jgi:hypothetical protein
MIAAGIRRCLLHSTVRPRCASSALLSTTTLHQPPLFAYGVGETWLDTLGFDKDDCITTPTKIAQTSSIPASSIGCGWGHSVIVSHDSLHAVVLGRPLDFKNALKHINTRGSLPAFQRFIRKSSNLLFSDDVKPLLFSAPAGDSFSKVVCGMGSLTVFLMKSGKLMAFGHNFFGQCGIGESKTEIVYAPMEVKGFDEDEVIHDAAAGIEHVLAVSRSGKIYSWGRGDRGQLGHGDKDSYMSPARILGTSETFLTELVSRVAANSSVSACITTGGELYIWGKMQGTTQKEQRGDGYIMSDQLWPRKVEWLTEETAPLAQDLTMGQAHTCILTRGNRMWMIGLRGRGKVYDDSHVKFLELFSTYDVAQVAEHLHLPIPEVQAWKDEASAFLELPEIPLPEVYMQTEPFEVNASLLRSKKIVAMRSGLHFSYAITDDGGVYRVGWRGLVLPASEFFGMNVGDAQFGYAHTLLLAP